MFISILIVHPATWFKVEFSDGQIVTFRPSALRAVGDDFDLTETSEFNDISPNEGFKKYTITGKRSRSDSIGTVDSGFESTYSEPLHDSQENIEHFAIPVVPMTIPAHLIIDKTRSIMLDTIDPELWTG